MTLTMNDVEIRKTKEFAAAKKAYPALNGDAQITIARTAIKANWEAMRQERQQQVADNLWDQLDSLGYDVEDVQVIKISRDGELTLKERPRRERWSDDDYVPYIGQEFTRNVTKAKNIPCGDYTLKIMRPHNRNHPVPFRAILTRPEGKKVHYPPRFDEPRETRTYIEVSTMTGLMHEAFGTTISPRVHFKMED